MANDCMHTGMQGLFRPHHLKAWVATYRAFSSACVLSSKDTAHLGTSPGRQHRDYPVYASTQSPSCGQLFIQSAFPNTQTWLAHTHTHTHTRVRSHTRTHTQSKHLLKLALCGPTDAQHPLHSNTMLPTILTSVTLDNWSGTKPSPLSVLLGEQQTIAGYVVC